MQMSNKIPPGDRIHLIIAKYGIETRTVCE